jgi:hypothetical protein
MIVVADCGAGPKMRPAGFLTPPVLLIMAGALMAK